MNKNFKLVGAAVLALGVSVISAQASPLPTFNNGTLTIVSEIDPVLSAFPSGPNANIFAVDTSANASAYSKPVTGDFLQVPAIVGNDTPSFTSPAGALNFNAGQLSTLGFTGDNSGTIGTFTALSTSAADVLDANHVAYFVSGTWTVGSDFANAGSVIPNSVTEWVFTLFGGNISAQGQLTANVPEPSTLSLFGVALLGFGFMQLSKKRKSVLAV